MSDQSLIRRVGKAVVLGIGVAFALSVLLIALPFTEKVIPWANSNLHFKDSYQKINYTIETDELDIEKLNYGRNIIYDRLKKYGVEEFYVGKPFTVSTTTPIVSTSSPATEDLDKLVNSLSTSTSSTTTPTEETKTTSQFVVTIQTSKATTSINTLISSSNDIRLMTAKEGVNLDDEENQLTALLPESYNPTEFGPNFFRSVVVSRMKQNDGTFAYYAFFKVWPTDTKRYEDFMKANLGKNIGIYVDGFVIKYKVESVDQTDLILNLGSDEDVAKVNDIVYNSGVIPFSATVKNTENLAPDDLSFDYLKAIISFIAVMIIVSAIVFLRTRQLNKAIRFIITLGFLISAWISIYKLFNIRIDSFIFVMGGLVGTLLTYSAITMGYKFKIVAIISTVIMIFAMLVGVGIVAEIAKNLAFLTLGSVICDSAVNIFFKTIKNI